MVQAGLDRPPGGVGVLTGRADTASKSAAERVLRALSQCRDELDAISSHVAAAHVDSAIEALCREHGLVRFTSKTD